MKVSSMNNPANEIRYHLSMGETQPITIEYFRFKNGELQIKASNGMKVILKGITAIELA